MNADETHITGAAALTATSDRSAFAAANCREPPSNPAGAHSAFPQIS